MRRVSCGMERVMYRIRIRVERRVGGISGGMRRIMDGVLTRLKVGEIRSLPGVEPIMECVCRRMEGVMSHSLLG